MLTGRVTGTVARIVAQEGVPQPFASARVVFLARVGEFPAGTDLVIPDRVTCRLDAQGRILDPTDPEGVRLGVELAASENVVGGFTTVVRVEGPSFTTRVFDIIVRSGETIDIATVVRVPPDPGRVVDRLAGLVSHVQEWVDDPTTLPDVGPAVSAASASATAAAESAQQAHESALAAAGSAGDAHSDRVAAEAAAQAAAGSATTATTAAAHVDEVAATVDERAGDAEQAATQAAGARDEAVTARGQAEVARQGAQQALAGVPSAVEGALDTQVQAAQSAASAAQTSEVSAANNAASASAAAETATTMAAQMLADARAARDVTLQARDTALAAVGQMVPEWDEAAGEYEPSSMATFMRVRRDGQVYGVSVPKGMATACTKTGSNAGIPAPTPGVIGTPAVDQYRDRGAFRFLEVNAFVDLDGTAHVTGIAGDGRFKRDGSNGDVWILAPVLWWRVDASASDAVVFSVSDSPLAGLSPQPKAYLPDGSLRPFMLYAKYALSIDSGTPRSVSGAAVAIRSVSHNSLITTCKNATTGYSAKSIADDWYMKIMFLLKYATKHSQSVFSGCSAHDVSTNPTLAETGVTRVVVAKAKADQVPVGSTMMMGKTSTDRQNPGAFDVFDALRVLRKDAVDASNVAIVFDTQVPFSTDLSYNLLSAPWRTGSCDLLEGDGSPTSRTSGREPFVLQGIEMGLGMTEILGDVILSNDGTLGWQIYTLADSRQAATSVTAAYQATGKTLPTDANDSWKNPLYPDSALGLLFGTGMGASQTTGICDGTYTNKLTSTGTREWRSLGNLWDGGNAGVFYVLGNSGLSGAGWNIGSRLSGNGRSRG